MAPASEEGTEGPHQAPITVGWLGPHSTFLGLFGCKKRGLTQAHLGIRGTHLEDTCLEGRAVPGIDLDSGPESSVIDRFKKKYSFYLAAHSSECREEAWQSAISSITHIFLFYPLGDYVRALSLLTLCGWLGSRSDFWPEMMCFYLEHLH